MRSKEAAGKERTADRAKGERKRQRLTTGERATATAMHSAQKNKTTNSTAKKREGKGAWGSNRGRDEIRV